MKRKILGFLVLVVWSTQLVMAESFCFLQAETPYEQDYCILVSEGVTQLPDFVSFQRNDPQMQHLLMKPYAKRLGISITPPPKKNQRVKKHPFARDQARMVSSNKESADTPKAKLTESKPEVVSENPSVYAIDSNLPKNSKDATSATSTPHRSKSFSDTEKKPQIASLATPSVHSSNQPILTAIPRLQLKPQQSLDSVNRVKNDVVGNQGKQPITKVSELPKAVVEAISPKVELGLANCFQQTDVIQCDKRRYKLLRNRSTQDLDREMFESANQLGFSTLLPSVTDVTLVNSYLLNNYERYLAGMNRIGLVEASMNFNKFKRLFHHIRDAGADFPGRFETMYHYLKKDKKSLAVKVGSEIPTLRVDQCLRVGITWLSCQADKHYVFQQEN